MTSPGSQAKFRALNGIADTLSSNPTTDQAGTLA